MGEFLKIFDLKPFDVVMISVCAALFLVFWKLMDRILFAPYLALIRAREAATLGAEKGALTDKESAAAAQSEYEAKILNARVSALEKKMAVVELAKKEAALVLEEAEATAQEEVRNVRWELANNMTALRQEALAQVDSVADLICGRVKNPVARSRSNIVS